MHNGLRACYGILMPLMAIDLGFSNTAGSIVFWVNWVVYALASFVVGASIDRNGVKPAAVAWGSIGVGVLLAVTATVGDAWQLIVVFGFCAGGVGALMGSVPANVAPTRWFRTKVGSALGVINTGVGFGTFVLPLLLGLVLAHHNWRIGWLALAIAIPVVIVPSARWYGTTRPPAPAPETGPAPTDTAYGMRDLTRSKGFWGLFVAFMLGLVAQYGVFVHLPGAALAAGITPATVAATMSVAGALSIVSRVVFGWMADRVRDPALVVFPGTACYVAAMVVASRASSVGGFVVAAGLIGFGTAVYGPMWGTIIASRFPPHILGRAFGALMIGAGVGGALGPVLVGVILDTGHGYGRAWLTLGVIAVAAIPLFFVRDRTQVPPNPKGTP